MYHVSVCISYVPRKSSVGKGLRSLGAQLMLVLGAGDSIIQFLGVLILELLQLKGERHVVVQEPCCVIIPVNLRDALDTVLVGRDEDGGNGEAQEHQRTEKCNFP